MSVNLSATNFHNLNLPRMIAATLAEFGLAPGDLMLEITEGVVLDATAGTLRTIAELHRLGVRLSMDDFGTGYSSLGHLRRLIVDELKLDRSFVQGLESDDAARALTSAVIRIGESLSLPVVAGDRERRAAALPDRAGLRGGAGLPVFGRPCRPTTPGGAPPRLPDGLPVATIRPHLISGLVAFPICDRSISGIYFKPKLSRPKYLRPRSCIPRAPVAHHGVHTEMKIVCIGGGPAGLYFGLLMKLQDPANEVTVIERNRPYDTFGWGVVFSDATMQNLREADPVSAQTIGDAFNHWDDIDIHFRVAACAAWPWLHRHRPQEVAEHPAGAL